jgi:hypothetical protein
MGRISEEHVEWAVVSRFRSMLEDPPKTEFNVSQSFALFTATLLWTKQRAWVGGEGHDRPQWFNKADHAARDAREALRAVSIFKEPWSLSSVVPQSAAVDDEGLLLGPEAVINSDFEEMKGAIH